MRTIFSLLTNFLLALASFAQTTIENEYPAWGQPIIKKLIAKDPTVIGYGVKGNDKFINIAILDKKTKIIYWVNAAGYVEDKIVASDFAFTNILNKTLSPFKYHQQLSNSAVEIYDDALTYLRYPKIVLKSNAIKDYNAYIKSVVNNPDTKAFKNILEKLGSLYSQRQDYLYREAMGKADHIKTFQQDSIFGRYLLSITPGKIELSQHTDTSGTATFYSTDDISPVYKAVLNIATAKLTFFLHNQKPFDSLQVNRKKILQLINDSTNVFTLYRNYNLWKLNSLDSLVKQLYEYHNNKKLPLFKKKATETLLASFNITENELTQQIAKQQTILLSKLDMLYNVDAFFIQQRLRETFTQSPTPNLQSHFGYYNDNEGLVINHLTDDPIMFYRGSVWRGEQNYQLTDHRGNVMAVVTDKKIPHDDNHDGIIDYYTADVVKATDYSSFGAPLPGRTFQIKPYKYTYNSKEFDDETGYLDYGSRMYDPNIARFLSVDPLTKGYSMLTPYQYASNNPILNIDLDGLEGVKATDVEKKTITIKVDVIYVLKQTKKEASSNLDTKQLERIKKNLNKELNKESFKDEITGYDVKFEVNFKPMNNMSEVNKELNNNDNIQDNRMFLKMNDETDLGIITDADGNEFQKIKQGASNWRVYNVTSSRDGHVIAHELFHNLTHNHKNAPADIKTQIDPNNQQPGHKAAGGIFIYGDARDGTKTENINQKNIQDVLRSLPEEEKPKVTTPVSTTIEKPKG